MNGATKTRRFDQVDGMALALGVLLVLAMCLRISFARPLAGVTGDEGTYLCTAKSLADGQGYRHPNLPGEPKQTKYPPVFPILLAAGWRLNPQFPGNLVLVQYFHALLSGFIFWVVYRLVRYDWQAAPPLAIGSAVAGLFHPHWWSSAQTALSEVTYTALALAAVAAAACATRPPGNQASRTRALVIASLAGLLAAAAALTRIAGLSVVLAVLVPYLAWRRWTNLLAAAVAAAIPLIAWAAWCAAAAGVNQGSPFVFELDYSSWLPNDAASWAWVVYLNIARLFLAIAAWVTLWPLTQLSLALNTPGAVAVWAAFVLLFALIVVGLIRVVRRGAFAAPAYLIFYWLVVLAWPGDPETPFRLQVPVWPLIVAFLLLGFEGIWLACAGWVFARQPTISAPPAPATGSAPAAPPVVRRAGRAAEAARTATGWLAVVLVGWNIIVGISGASQHKQLAAATAMSELADYLRTQCPPDAVVAAQSTGYLYLRSGRKVVFPAPGTEIVPFAYPSDGRFATAGLIAGNAAMRAFRDHLDRELAPYYRRAGVTHLALGGGTGRVSVVQELVRSQPANFKLKDRVGSYEVFEVLPAPE